MSLGQLARLLHSPGAMFAHRVLVHAGAVLFLTWMSGCGSPPYGGARCEAISLTSDPASLPLGGRVAVPENSFQQVQPFIEGTGELGCCVSNAYFSARADCGAVDCEALRARLTVAGVRGDYVNEPCGRRADVFSPQEGAGTCSLYLDGETIVGVRASCLD